MYLIIIECAMQIPKLMQGHCSSVVTFGVPRCKMNGFSAIIYSLLELLELHQVKKHTSVANILGMLLNDM